MKTTDYQSLIERMSVAEKDELIVRLWHDLQDARTRSKELEQQLTGLSGHATDASPLREKLKRAGSAKDRHER